MSNPFVRKDEAAPISDVNVVPLADVSLVLLIILLVLSPMAAQSMLRVQAAAAKARSTESPKEGEYPLAPKTPETVLAVGLTPRGFIVDGRLLANDAELTSWLAARFMTRADKKVFLSPELDVPNGRVVSAIEAIQSSGAQSVALVQVLDPEQVR